MAQQYRNIEVERQGDVFLVRVKGGSLDESWIDQLGSELYALIDGEGCRKLVLNLGVIDCLYSMLLAKLLSVQRHLNQLKGRLKLCDVPPLVREVFRACKLEKHFEFVPDRDGALKDW